MKKLRFLCTLCIPYKHWKNEYSKHAYLEGKSSKPKGFRVGFVDYLTHIAQSNGICCAFKNNNNWFSAEKGNWIGKLVCWDPSCQIKFKLVSEKVSIYLYFKSSLEK